jgi:Na+/glutamate symporter
VLSGGFTGLSLGSTPTAIASMSAITRRYGPPPTSFMILPLVSAFFVDIVNVGAISLFRGGSVCLNSSWAAAKWFSARVTPPPGLALAG